VSDYLTKLFSLEGRKAVVTGGEGVLCGQMCHALARAGAEVMVAGVHAENGAKRVAAIEAEGGKAHFHSTDVTSRESLQKLCDTACEKMGQVDILINGAGINSSVPYFEIEAADWDRVLGINLKGLHLSCQVFGKHMTERGTGAIINLGSASAEIPLSRVFAYSVSKAAVVNLTKNLAREFAPSGVRVNSISPGFFPAEQNRKVLDADRIASIMARTPMNRFGEPHELDATIILLASETGGAFITGANFIVDGGFGCMSI